MTDAHPNLALLERLFKLIPFGLASTKDLLADKFVWHYFNPRLPELEGDYAGANGLQMFFQKLGMLTKGTFRVKEGQVIPVGDELVVTTNKPMMTLEGKSFETDAVVVWLVVENRIAEAGDIPAIHSSRPKMQG